MVADNEQIILISDVHLDPRVPGRQDSFLEFLDTVLPGTDRLIILGDLFEFWFGYKSVIFHHYFPVLDRIWHFTRAGKPVHYIAGNHDFHMGPFIRDTLGINIIDEGFELKLNGKRYYLCHGDCINPKDYGYRMLHWITRRWLTVKLFGWIPPDTGFRLALKLSDGSRQYTSNRDVVPRNRILEFLHTKLEEGYDGMIYGHTHSPEYTEIVWNNKPALLINSGDWINHKTYLAIANGTISLNSFTDSLPATR